MNCLLLAEDDSDLRLIFKSYLESQGWNVLEAVDGTSAMALVTPNITHAVLDERMPGYTGSDVAVHLRRVAPGAYIILISAEPPHCSAANAILTKPVLHKELVDTLQQSLTQGAT